MTARRVWMSAAALAFVAAPLFADEPGELAPEPAPAPAAETEPAPAPAVEPAAPPAGDETMRELMELRQQVEPAPSVESAPAPASVPGEPAAPDATPAATANLNRAVLGVAPGQPRPTLRREGEFVVSRRGRVIRSPDGGHALFTFDADARNTPEPPMILQPNQMLENMERVVEMRGDSAVFEVSGQVHTYRGANYLLVTMMKLTQDQGNLQH